MQDIVVRFRSGTWLGDIDDHQGGVRVVAPAWEVLESVEDRKIDDSRRDAGFRRERHEEMMKELRELGGAMVEVLSFGMVVGEYLVRPYLVDARQYEILMAMDAA